jgi:hypothetical protein
MVTRKKSNPQKSGPPDCVGQSCEWVGSKAGGIDPTCSPGSGGCEVAHLLEAEESNFHDQQLVKATRKIRRILAKIPADPAGRKLSFCSTNMGILLAWVRHGGKVTSRRVTAKDDDATVAKALGLKRVPPAARK